MPAPDVFWLKGPCAGWQEGAWLLAFEQHKADLQDLRTWRVLHSQSKRLKHLKRGAQFIDHGHRIGNFDLGDVIVCDVGNDL